ncbi:hypothetical protein G6F35_016104 [Rhizopus arrhizus]|nr:hypothetical protein G6F35_016104 [Rhizopus arrhizus]
MEQALEESSAPYFDGFIGARKAFFDLGAVEDEGLLPPRGTRLWKIHGSLNWRLEGKTDVVRSDEKTDKQNAVSRDARSPEGLLARAVIAAVHLRLFVRRRAYQRRHLP